MTLADAPIENEDFLICPACGYDLRGAVDERCAECGLVFDRASLLVSGVPWAHRRKIGRVWAYVKTVWQVTADSRALAHEASKPQDLADARSFRRVTAWVVFASLMAPFLAAVADSGGMGFIPVPASNALPAGQRLTPWTLDLVVPWAAGATLWPVAVLCIALVAFHLTGAPRYLFRSKSLAPAHRRRALAIAHYASAPLALLLLAVACLWGIAIMTWLIQGQSVGVEFALLLVVCSLAIAVLAVAGTVLRVAQWLARVRHGGMMTRLLGAAGLLGLWLIGLALLLGGVPWWFGFFWLVFDSLR